MDRYLDVLDVEVTTRARYETAIRLHVRPLLGSLPVAKLTGETIDAFHAVLRRCRQHCDGRPFIVHGGEPRPGEAHECTDMCRPHVCKPLSTASIRKIHFCLCGALTRAVRWRWITVNPLDAAEAPRGVTHNPHPPSAEQAAAILTAAFAADLEWGVLVWLAMTTGARRGELCALRWDGLDLDSAVLSIRSSITQEGSRSWEKDTKTHQQRRIAACYADSPYQRQSAARQRGRRRGTAGRRADRRFCPVLFVPARGLTSRTVGRSVMPERAQRVGRVVGGTHRGPPQGGQPVPPAMGPARRAGARARRRLPHRSKSGFAGDRDPGRGGRVGGGGPHLPRRGLPSARGALPGPRWAHRPAGPGRRGTKVEGTVVPDVLAGLATAVGTEVEAGRLHSFTSGA